MTRHGTLARVAVVLVAAAALVVLVHSLRLVHLTQEGVRAARAAQDNGDEARIRSAERELGRASRRNPDPEPTLQEAALALARDDRRRAIALCEEVISANRGSVPAWECVQAAAFDFDPARFRRAGIEIALLVPELR